MDRRLLRLLVALLALTLLAAACGDSDDGDAEDADDGEGALDGADEEQATPGLDPEFVELFQNQLAAVGCYDGPIDGIDGPATLAAIRRFQAAQGLAEDGVVGPATESALQQAVEAGVTGCTADGDDAPVEGPDADDGEGALDGVEGPDADDGGGALDGADGPRVTVSATDYANEFVVDVCDNPTETTISLTATTSDGEGRVDISATDGQGAISVSGNLLAEGVVTSVQVGDAGNFTIQGTFDDPTFGDFVAEGSCAGA